MGNPHIATGTPVVTVNDNRGLAIRTLNWNRELCGDPLRLLVGHSYVDDASRVAAYRDPRLFAAWTTDSTAPANLCTTPSLAGQVLRRESTDSGERVTLFNATGRAVWTRDGRGTVKIVAYDELGRPMSGSEQLSGSDDIRVSWRNEYGDSAPADDLLQGNNLRGVSVAQYDDGGLLQVNSVALSGVVLSQTQRFLASAEDLPDWPEDETGREALLEAGKYNTTVSADVLGAVLSQTDAKGHKQRWRYDVSGAVCHQAVTPAGGAPQTLLNSVTWSAAGQVLTEQAGNGVITTYGYDAQNQWLSTITAQRADNTTLQALSYEYDFIGNVTSVTDGTVASGYYRNQATDGRRIFTYDAVYQLLSATGRENADNTGMQYSSLPGAVPEGSQYVNYTRCYLYDDSGNLFTLTHAGAGNYTRIMMTEANSNRSVQQNDGGPQTPDEVSGWFDSNGNLLTLQASASGTDPLAWDGNNNLQSVTLVRRSSGDHNREVYQYSGSRRVRKQTRILANSDKGLWNVAEVRYLPGLELHRRWQETAESENPPSEELHVMTGQAGRANIRVLHWQTGKPDDIDNNQVRWSVGDNIGSLSLELDAEGQLISREEYYPFGGTAVWAARHEIEASYKTVRYSGKERDGTGLYYYGHRYYAPWLCRWVSADPAQEVDGLNLFRMVGNNPITHYDVTGLVGHPELETRGIAAGEAIGKLLVQAGTTPNTSSSSLSAQTAAITDMITEFSQTLKDYGTRMQKTAGVHRAFASAMAGNKNTYANQYRSANPDQDELISTQTVYSIFSGMSKYFRTAGITMTPAQENLIKATFEFISLIRLPTKGSGYSLPGEAMQHPTSPKTVMFGSSGKNHGKADLARRHEAILILEKNLLTASPTSVMQPLLDMAEHMTKYTLQEFTGPAAAANMTPLTTNAAERDEQTRVRDSLKHISAIRLGQKSHRVNPIAATANKNAPWQRQKLPPHAGNSRSFSPFRFN